MSETKGHTTDPPLRPGARVLCASRGADKTRGNAPIGYLAYYRSREARGLPGRIEDYGALRELLRLKDEIGRLGREYDLSTGDIRAILDTAIERYR